MKANNVTICVPSHGCTKGCPYCISKMTPTSPEKSIFSEERIRLALDFAKTLGATSLLITSRGEPLLNDRDVMSCVKIAKDKFIPSELQTNGDIPDYVTTLAKAGLSVYAVSIDSCDQIKRQSNLFENVCKSGMILRWTVALCDDTMQIPADKWIEFARVCSVRQLTFRKLTVPSNPQNMAPVKWISDHTKGVDEWMRKVDDMVLTGKVIRKLSFGPLVYDINGVSVTHFPYCIQEGGNDDELRSLIMREDGHVYTDWSSLASVLF